MVAKIYDGGLAFLGKRVEQVGTVADHGFSDDDSPTFGDVDHPGMTLRDWFAGQALNAFLVPLTTANEESIRLIAEQNGLDGFVTNARVAASVAYGYADAMIAARKVGA